MIDTMTKTTINTKRHRRDDIGRLVSRIARCVFRPGHECVLGTVVSTSRFTARKFRGRYVTWPRCRSARLPALTCKSASSLSHCRRCSGATTSESKSKSHSPRSRSHEAASSTRDVGQFWAAADVCTDGSAEVHRRMLTTHLLLLP